jgi:hypothetical protein
MPIYEKRTYDIRADQIVNLVRLYKREGWPALEAGGFDQNLVGYFLSDTGTQHQLVHIWRFEDDAARRDFWRSVFKDEAFMDFVAKIQDVYVRQDVQLLRAAPWGPKP